MALSVKFTAPTDYNTDANTVLHLKCDRITYAINRLPSQLALPGVNTNGKPVEQIIDIGVSQEVFTLEGVVDLTETVVTGAEIMPSLTILANAIMRWWWPSSGMVDTTANFDFIKMEIILQGISTLTYYGSFKSANFVLTGGQDDRAIFNIQFARRRVDTDDG